MPDGFLVVGSGAENDPSNDDIGSATAGIVSGVERFR